MLLNTAFQLTLNELFATRENLKEKLFSSEGCMWLLGCLEDTDDMCFITHSTV